MSPSIAFGEGEHLSDTALLQFQQGTVPLEALPSVDAHLFSCPVCQASLERLFLSEGMGNAEIVSLKQALSQVTIQSPLPQLQPFIAGYPDFDTIADYIDGTLPPKNIPAFEVALKRFSSLSGHVEQLRSLRQELGEADIQELVAPPIVVQKPGEVKSRRKTWTDFVPRAVPYMGTAFSAAALVFIFLVMPLKNQFSSLSVYSAQSRQELDATKKEVSAAQYKAARLQDVTTRQKRELDSSHAKVKELTDINASSKAAITKSETIIAQLKTQALQSLPTPQAPPTPQIPPSTSSLVGRQDDGPTTEDLLLIQSRRDAPSLYADNATSSTSQTRGVDGSKTAILYPKSPVATKIRDLLPVLQWFEVPKATSYLVSLHDDTFGLGDWVFKERTTKGSSMPIEKELTAGHSYHWVISAYAGATLIAQPAQEELRFAVLSEAEQKTLDQNLKASGDSRHKQIRVLVTAGLLDEAFRLATNHPGANR